MYHLDDTLNNSAIARNPRRPLSNLSSGFLRNTRRRILHAFGALHYPLNRFSNLCVTSYTVSMRKHCNISVTTQPAGQLALFFIFPRARRTRSTVICMCRLWRATRLSPLHLSYLTLSACTSGVSIFIVVTMFRCFFRQVVSVLAGPPFDPEFRQYGSLHNLASGKGPSAGVKLSSFFSRASGMKESIKLVANITTSVEPSTSSQMRAALQ